MSGEQQGETAEAGYWHCLDAGASLRRLEVSAETGLAGEAVSARLERYGPNEIQEGERRTLGRIILSQFADFMIIVLLAAALISGIVGEPQDTITILVIVLLNAAIGAVQEYRAQQAVAALKSMAAPTSRVRRRGQVETIDARELVPGDIVLLEAGEVVAADLRLLQSANLEVDEAALTGESLAVAKHIAPLEERDLPLGDRRNMAYKGTLVTRGRAEGVAVATGMESEIGRIAALLGGGESIKTPLQKRLTRFSQRLALAVLAICTLIFAAGLVRGEPLVLMFLTAVSLAVAAIPEALPAVVTISLAFGARKMSRKQALIRHLPAVETLGSVSYICADKTGTLTHNRMHLEQLLADGRRHASLPIPGEASEPLGLLGRALALNNDVLDDGEKTRGEPTELALFEAARQAGYSKSELQESMPRLAELTFDAERKRMTTLHRDGDGVLAFCKGAPEQLLPRCSDRLTAAGRQPFDEGAVLAEAEALACEGYRVLAVACRRFEGLPEPLDADTVESELTLLGLVALIDPPREEAHAAVADCRSAGITPVMITGDHPGTARAIAGRLGILGPEDDHLLTGVELAQLSPAKFEERVEQVRVYARVTPAQKLTIVEALQKRGAFVAMTGDGVNDAPALKRADIGVAMGQKGTDVAREAADMVLLDDNFATIVSAVREGRRIFDNIRKFIKYTMTSNAGEIWTLFLAPFLGLPIPLLPIHILWINLVTDGLPGLALTTEPKERNVMDRGPRPVNESIFSHGMWQHMVWVGLLIGGITILAQAWAIQMGSDNWQTIAFTVLTFSQLVHVLVIRSESDAIFSYGLLSNRAVLGAVLLTVGLQLAVIYLPLLNGIFRTAPLSMGELLLCFALPLVVLVAVEMEKLLVRRGLLYQNSRG